MRREIAALVSLSLAFVARSSAADEDARRLGLVHAGPDLQRSAVIALAPWKIELRNLDVTPPSDQIGAASRDAETIAGDAAVDAVAWLVETGGARTLLLYDAHTKQIVSREVAPGPIDAAAAAAIALSLKTLLRASTVAPERERLGGQDLGPQSLGQFRLEGDIMARFRASDGTRVDPRVGLAVAWWPRPFGRFVGFALRLETGTGLPVQNAELSGRLADYAVSLGVRGRIPLAPHLAIEPGVAGALHLTLLDGATADGDPVSDLTRVDPVLETSLQLTLGLGRSLELGLRGGALFWQRSQQYEVDGRAALTLSTVQAEVGLVLGAALNP
jgi:hypothetical protein